MVDTLAQDFNAVLGAKAVARDCLEALVHVFEQLGEQHAFRDVQQLHSWLTRWLELAHTKSSDIPIRLFNKNAAWCLAFSYITSDSRFQLEPALREFKELGLEPDFPSYLLKTDPYLLKTNNARSSGNFCLRTPTLSQVQELSRIYPDVADYLLATTPLPDQHKARYFQKRRESGTRSSPSLETLARLNEPLFLDFSRKSGFQRVFPSVLCKDTTCLSILKR